MAPPTIDLMTTPGHPWTKMKIALTAVIAFVVGYFAHVFVEDRLTAQRHWKAIANWNLYLTNQNVAQIPGARIVKPLA